MEKVRDALLIIAAIVLVIFVGSEIDFSGLFSDSELDGKVGTTEV